MTSLRLQRVLLGAILAGSAVLFWRASYDVFNTLKATWIAAGTVLLASVGALRAVEARRVQVQVTVAWWPVLLVLAGLAVGTVTAPNPLRAVVGEPGRHTGLAMYVVYALLFGATLRLFRDRPSTAVTATLVGTAVPVAGYGLLQALGVEPFAWRAFEAGPQVTSTLGNANFLAAWLGIVTPLAALWVMDRGQPVAIRAGAGAAGVLALGVASVSGSLQGVAAAGVGLIVLALAVTRGRVRLAIVGGAVVVAAAAVGAVVAGAGPLSTVRDNARVSVESRVGKWQVALSMAADHPVTGVGPSGYGDRYYRHRPPEVAARDGLERSVDDPHALPLAMLTAGGAVAALGWVGFVGLVGLAAVRGARRADGSARLEVGAVAGAWAGYQVQSLVSIDVPPLAVLHWVLAGILVARGLAPDLRELRLPGAPPGGRRARTSPGLVAIVALLALVAVVALVTPLRADVAVAAARRAEDPQTAIDRYEGAAGLASWEGQYPAMEGALLTELRFFEAARDQHLEAHRREPLVLVHAINVARLSAALGQHDEAARWYERALDVDPTTPVLLEEVGVFHLEHGDPARAREVLQRAVDVAPRSPQLWTFLGRAHDALGDEAAARRAFEHALELDPEFEPARTAMAAL